MLRENQLHNYQAHGVNHVVTQPRSMLWWDMGLGKSIAVLSAINRLFDYAKLRGVVVFAPLRVCETVWEQEASKWEHTGWMKFSAVIGPAQQRIDALHTPAQVYLVNYENAKWFVEQIQKDFLNKRIPPPFNMVVYDEISKLKSARVMRGGSWGQHLRKLRHFLDWRVGLTGTPASNGLLDLFGQYLMIDDGARLGTTFIGSPARPGYRARFFGSIDYGGFKFAPLEGAREAIGARISDITMNMSEADYLSLPPFIHNDIWVELTPKLQHQYDRMEREMMVTLNSGIEVEILNAGSKVGRSLQFANGAMFIAAGSDDWEEIHKIKLKALDDIVEEAAGQPVLITYQFRHDVDRLLKHLKGAVWFNGVKGAAASNKLIDDWNKGLVPYILIHCNSGHGIDRLQEGSNIVVWFGLTWARDLYDQLNARLRRQGQRRPVILHRIMCRNTVEEAQYLSLEAKYSAEQGFRKVINDYWDHKQRLAA